MSRKVRATITLEPDLAAFVVMSCRTVGGGPLDQILTVDKERLLDKVGQLSPPMMLKVDQAIRYSLGLKWGLECDLRIVARRLQGASFLALAPALQGETSSWNQKIEAAMFRVI